MSATAGECPLHDCLKQFLSCAEVRYFPVTVRLVSLSPAQLSQDDECFLEATALSKELIKDTKLAKMDLARSKVLVRLADWKFVVSRIPNTTDYSLDIDVKTYEVLPAAQARGSEVLARKLVNILETNPFAQLYEDYLRKLVRTRDEHTDMPGVVSSKAVLQQKIESKADEGSNQNKYSFRPRHLLTQQLSGKESGNHEGLTLRKTNIEPDAALRSHTPGIRVSGINGKQNMRKLKDFKKSYNTASQESLTHQVIGIERLESGLTNGNRNDESPVKTRERPIYLKKRSFDDEEPTHQRAAHLNQDSQTRLLPVSEKVRPGLAGNADEAQYQKKAKGSQRLDFQLGGLGEDGLNYDELMDCLSLERGLVHWEDLIFSKDVVKYLKNHISDLLDKK